MDLILLSLLTLVAATIGTTSGFGISTLMVPVTLLFLPLPETLLLVGAIHWFGDVWKMLLFKHGIDKKILLYFGVPGVIAAVAGGLTVVNIPQDISSRVVGLILILYVVYLLYKPNFKIKPSPAVAVLGGGGSGLLGGLTGVGGGALRSMVLLAFNIDKSVYLFTSGVLGALIDASRISAYIIGGTRIAPPLLLGFLLFIPASFLGAEIGKKIVDKIPQKSFRTVIAVFLLLLGIRLLIS
jgi:uncharacterized membrane protein YfcA